MSETTPLFMDISSAYSGDELGLPYRDIFGEGVVGAANLAVTQHGAGDLSVDVAAGSAWVLGDTNVNLQPCYRAYNDAVVNLGISPDPSNPRKVLVVAQITDEGFAGVGRMFRLVAIHGVAAAAPAEPALPASALPLALISVAAADTHIVTANIADRRHRARIGGQVGTEYVGTLAAGPPPNPQDGDKWIAKDVDANGTRWTFQYNAGSASAYKWEFLGGSAVRVIVSTDEGTATTNAWLNLATTGPDYSVVRNGDYDFVVSVNAYYSVASGGMGIGVANGNGTPSGEGQSQISSSPTPGTGVGSSAQGRVTGMAAGGAVRTRYFNSPLPGGTANFRFRQLAVLPVRIA